MRQARCGCCCKDAHLHKARRRVGRTFPQQELKFLGQGRRPLKARLNFPVESPPPPPSAREALDRIVCEGARCTLLASAHRLSFRCGVAIEASPIGPRPILSQAWLSCKDSYKIACRAAAPSPELPLQLLARCSWPPPVRKRLQSRPGRCPRTRLARLVSIARRPQSTLCPWILAYTLDSPAAPKAGRRDTPPSTPCTAPERARRRASPRPEPPLR